MSKATKDSTIIVNAEMKTGYNWDYGYAIITETTDAPNYYDSNGRLIYIQGNNEATDYTTNLEAGKVYYLHLGYKRYGYPYQGSGSLTINSIDLKGVTYTTDQNGKIITTLEGGEYTLKEIKAPNDYEISPEIIPISIKRTTENPEYNITNARKRGKIIVQHYIENTQMKVPAKDGGETEDIEYTVPVKEHYEANPSNMVSDEYSIVSHSDNIVGITIDGTIYVTYYYNRFII